MSSLPTQTQAQLRAALITQFRSLINGLDTADGSDAAFKAGAIAHVMEGIYGRLDWVADQIFPDAAASANLERHATARGLTRKSPTAAEGTVTFTGTSTTAVPLGTAFTKNDGWAYETTAAGVIGGGGSVTVAAIATDLGADGNVSSGEEFTLTTPITGVDSNATAATDFTGGTDTETDAALLQRLLDNLRAPPAGGTAEDWRQWALAVDGVAEAFSHPLRRGPGTIDVTIFTTTVVAGSTVRALPGGALVTAVETYVETVRPVTVGSYQIVTATEVSVDITIDDLVVDEEAGYTPGDVQSDVEDALAAIFQSIDPGETLYLTSHIDKAITGVAGVVDYTVTAPATNTTATIDASDVEVLVAGTITVNLA